MKTFDLTEKKENNVADTFREKWSASARESLPIGLMFLQRGRSCCSIGDEQIVTIHVINSFSSRLNSLMSNHLTWITANRVKLTIAIIWLQFSIIRKSEHLFSYHLFVSLESFYFDQWSYLNRWTWNFPVRYSFVFTVADIRSQGVQKSVHKLLKWLPEIVTAAPTLSLHLIKSFVDFSTPTQHARDHVHPREERKRKASSSSPGEREIRFSFSLSHWFS